MSKPKEQIVRRLWTTTVDTIRPVCLSPPFSTAYEYADFPSAPFEISVELVDPLTELPDLNHQLNIGWTIDEASDEKDGTDEWKKVVHRWYTEWVQKNQ